MKKILFIIETPSPYRIAFMRELGKQCDLTVLFTRDKKHYGRPNDWYDFDFAGFLGITPGKRIGNLSLGFSKYISTDYDLIIHCDYSSFSGIYIHTLLNLRHIRYAIEVDGGFYKDGKTLKERMKKILISSANWWLSTSKMTDRYLLKYGADKNKIYRYPFTSIYRKDILKSVDPNRKMELRKKNGIKENKVIVSVGRFVHGKGFDVLLNACKNIDASVGVYIIGGKPTAEYIKLQNELKRDTLHFIDYMHKSDLMDYYDMADLFVFPTRGDVWGLVVNEAMARGLPVITTERCVAGIELVQNGVNGYITPVENSDVLADRINEVINDEKKLESMSKCALDMICRYTYEQMAEQHIEIFKQIIR